MGEIVNLRRTRKRAERARAEREAAGNRARHGLTKAERATRESEARRAADLLDGARRTASCDPSAPGRDRDTEPDTGR